MLILTLRLFIVLSFVLISPFNLSFSPFNESFEVNESVEVESVIEIDERLVDEFIDNCFCCCCGCGGGGGGGGVEDNVT